MLHIVTLQILFNLQCDIFSFFERFVTSPTNPHRCSLIRLNLFSITSRLNEYPSISQEQDTSA